MGDTESRPSYEEQHALVLAQERQISESRIRMYEIEATQAVAEGSIALKRQIERHNYRLEVERERTERASIEARMMIEMQIQHEKIEACRAVEETRIMEKYRHDLEVEKQETQRRAIEAKMQIRQREIEASVAIEEGKIALEIQREETQQAEIEAWREERREQRKHELAIEQSRAMAQIEAKKRNDAFEMKREERRVKELAQRRERSEREYRLAMEKEKTKREEKRQKKEQLELEIQLAQLQLEREKEQSDALRSFAQLDASKQSKILELYNTEHDFPAALKRNVQNL